MHLPATASALLAQLATSTTAPEPAAPSWPDYATDGGEYAPELHLTDAVLTPEAQADVIARLVRAAVAAARAQWEAERVAADAALRATLLPKLLSAPTDAERPPLETCAPLRRPRMDYRGWLR